MASAAQSFSAWFAGQTFSGSNAAQVFQLSVDLSPGDYVFAVVANAGYYSSGMGALVLLDGTLLAGTDTVGWRTLTTAPARIGTKMTLSMKHFGLHQFTAIPCRVQPASM